MLFTKQLILSGHLQVPVTIMYEVFLHFIISNEVCVWCAIPEFYSKSEKKVTTKSDLADWNQLHVQNIALLMIFDSFTVPWFLHFLTEIVWDVLATWILDFPLREAKLSYMSINTFHNLMYLFQILACKALSMKLKGKTDKWKYI